MAICKLDDKGYCERHKTTHTGRAKQLSQLDNEVGEKYRLSWDQQGPGFFDRALNFIKSSFEHLSQGLPKVSDEDYRVRLNICNTCDQCDQSISRWRCRACGCYLQESDNLPGKARWASQDCPLKKWPSVENNNKGCGCEDT